MSDSTNIGEAEARILERADLGINRALVELHILRGSTSLLDQARAVQLLNELDRYRNSQILTAGGDDVEVIDRSRCVNHYRPHSPAHDELGSGGSFKRRALQFQTLC